MVVLEGDILMVLLEGDILMAGGRKLFYKT
jgi:hypothetical protein